MSKEGSQNKLTHLLSRVRVFENWWEIIFPLTRLIPHPDRTMRIRGGKRIYLRNIFASDFYVTMEVFDRDDYGLKTLILPPRPVIVDAGANIGAFTLLVAQLFSEAKIFSFEPEESNFRVLSKNVQINGLVNVKPCHEAISSLDGAGFLGVDPKDNASHSLELSGTGSSQEVRKISLKTLMEREGLLKIDLLKLDIEGSEYEVLLSDPEILKRISRILLEVHDHPRHTPPELLEFLKNQGFEVQPSPTRHNVYWAIKNISTNRSIRRSEAMLERAKRVIPRGAQTLSKAPDQFVRGVSPYALEKGAGSRVWDVDGNEYLDLTCSLGAIVLGYGHPEVEEAIKRQRSKGTIFGLPGELEVELAEKIRDLIPFAEMSRFGLNGSDVTAAAVRVARAYTGRDHIAKCGYHGWQDWTIATNALRSKGVPQAVKDLTHEFGFNKLETLEKIFAEHPYKIAAVILETIDAQTPAPGFLEGVRELATKHGAVLVFDELVTGFRVARGGAAEYFKVQPDLACYGKAISNGEPLSVLAGKREIMSALNEVFFSFTYAGFLPSVAAALAVLEFMRKNNVQEKLWRVGTQLMDGLKKGIAKHDLPIMVQGYGVHPILSFKDAQGADDLELKTLFLQETAKAGMLTNAKHFVSYSHDPDQIESALEKFDQIFVIMSAAHQAGKVASLLEGPVVAARYVRP